MYSLCTVIGPRLTLRPFVLEDAGALVELQDANRQAFEPYMPVRPEEFFTVDAQLEQIGRDRQQWVEDRGFAFAMVVDGRLAGRISLSNVVRGAWQNATVGYWVDSREQGRGYATEALHAVVQAAFEHFDLHRVQAAIMPKNAASLRVIEKAAWQCEGLAPYYLHINGQWEDHQIFSLTREQYHADSRFSIEPLV